jgi:AAA ATPase domain
MRSRPPETLDSLLEAARTGRSAALVVTSPPGIDRREILEQVTDPEAGFRVSRVAGTESDSDLPFSGLHQLCAQIVDQLERLTEPHREVLRAAFDPAAAAPDPRLAGLAVFSLLAHAAEERPLVCVIDNAERLDPPSRQALAFTARRLVSESVALLFLVHDATCELAGLPEVAQAEEFEESAQ